MIALVRASTGKIAATYSYDAWGNPTVTNAAGYTVGDKNPFRYRGYYYDTETGLYYLNSRYYSPEFGRFISADVFIITTSSCISAISQGKRLTKRIIDTCEVRAAFAYYIKNMKTTGGKSIYKNLAVSLLKGGCTSFMANAVKCLLN